MTRIERARHRVTVARYAIGISAAAALAVFAAAARSSHPGTHTVRPPARTQQEATAETDDGATFFDDGGSFDIGPSGGAAPQIQSGAS